MAEDIQGKGRKIAERLLFMYYERLRKMNKIRRGTACIPRRIIGFLKFSC